MKESVRSYYKYQFREQLDFRYRLYLMGKEKDLSKRITIAQNLMYRVFECGMGILSSPELEKPFLDLAKTLPVFTDVQYFPNSFLHVMTQSYTIGGHTRVVERWINNSPTEQRHSIVLLDQQQEPIPDKLRDVVRERNGELCIFDEKLLEKRALKLRELAMNYEYIVLHIHMYDPTAIVAFGTDDFTRPVIFFNHADHAYWCGSSIIDMLADLRDNDIAKKKRGIENVFTLRIPFEPNSKILAYPKSKEQSRLDLGLPLDKKIILTVGGAHKYHPFAGCEFCELVSEAISSLENIVCYGIGPTSNIGGWNNYGNKFVALGTIDYGEKYFDYLNASDVYINSLPISGGTAMLDALQFGKPILSYALFEDKLGDIIKGVETTYSAQKFIYQLQLILSSDVKARELAEKQYKYVMKYHGEGWRSNLEQMLKLVPKKHCVQNNKKKLDTTIDDLSVMNSLWCNSLSTKSWGVHDTYHLIRRILKL